MDTKEFLSILLLFIMIFIGIGAMSSTVHGANVNVISDFDNNTLTTVELSESQSKTIWGFENLAKVQTRTGGDMQNTHIETDEGLYNYEYMMLNDTIMEKNDRIYGKNGNQTLIAHYTFSPYAFAQIDILDFHGDSSSSSTYPAMKHTGDSITKTFKEYTDVESGYTPLYILDLDTNMKYQPGDKFTITYTDVLSTGLNRIIKTFQYVYAKDIVVENIIVENKTIENITYVDKVIENITYVDKVVEIPVYINKTVEIINYVNKTVENISYVNKTIEVPVYVNKTIEVINYVNKTIEVPIYVNKTIENITYVNKTVEVPVYVNKTIEVINYVNKTIVVPIYVDKVIENITFVNKTIVVPVYVNKTVEVPVFVNKTIEVPFYKIIVIPEIIIDNPVIPITNNTNTGQYNETNTDKILNNNTTNTNNVTSNINKENNTGTSTLDNIKTVTMEKTGNNVAGLILLIVLFLILIQIYREDDEK